jgi:tRNA (guanine-N7-)-methyltransferase
MPHAFLITEQNLKDLAALFSEERSIQIGDTLLKTKPGYVAIHQNSLLVPTLVIEPYLEQWFYTEIRPKGGGRYLIRIDRTVRIQRTAGVRLALAWIAHWLAGQLPGSSTETANIADFFAVLTAPADQQADLLLRLRRKLAPQLRTARLRELSQQYFIDLATLVPPFRWETLFANTNPVEIEIGPGKGKFLIEEAKRHPDRNYLAIEWAGRYLKVLAERIPKHQLTNVRLLAADARKVFAEWIPNNSVARVHVYYPDPWWKKRHAKYRLFTREFLGDLERALILGGTFHFATDVPRVSTELHELVNQHTGLEQIHFKIYRAGKEPPPGRSNFEIKRWNAGADIYEAIWRKGNLR